MPQPLAQPSSWRSGDEPQNRSTSNLICTMFQMRTFQMTRRNSLFSDSVHADEDVVTQQRFHRVHAAATTQKAMTPRNQRYSVMRSIAAVSVLLRPFTN
jgi:hypothetical protein